ncbi:hypothetical protein Afil01_18500 [Actinorhabdospora filicis]|uniref:N-acetyltransferase domain-containing protein n=1 Tax=Actinorhabdospora filicis TaxID=1785913 RepID=A0A9W6SIT3_9ACTN|nr:GNAT family N-acetyltransferase [Actinorhabdospora filicis]GLZ77043.1 hypothetical protein Afil01_18500 [Actinorhabdospora filicis]
MSTPSAVTLDIKTFTADDADLMRSLYDGWAEAIPVDQPGIPAPSLEDATRSLATPPHGARAEFLAAVADGTVVGAALMFMPDTVNTHFVHLEGWVNLGWRRRGVGTALRDAVEAKMREYGRTTWLAQVRENPGRESPGPAFAEATGMTRAMTEVCRRLHLEDLDDDVLTALSADCRTRLDGYEVLVWEDGTSGPHPEEYVDGLARLELRMDTDAPHGDIDMKPRTEPEPEAIRARSQRSGLQNMRCFNAAVRHVESGDIVAWTVLMLHPGEGGTFAYQNITVVDPAHRGRKFGTLVKLENLAAIRAACPDLRTIETRNADENAHMIAINDALGFRIFCLVHNYQKEI